MSPVFARVAIVGLLATLGSAGCGGGDSSSDAVPYTAPPTASVQQYASAVAEHRHDVQVTAAAMSACHFPVRDCIEENARPLGDATSALARSLVAASQRGDPPPEILDLYTRTVQRTQGVVDALNRLDGTRCSNLDAEGPCVHRFVKVQVAGDKLAEVLNGWEPYL